MTTAIEIENIRKSYGTKVAVEDLSLSIPKGELFAFLGPNGAGKTTTIKMVCGLLHPDRGVVRLCGPSHGSGPSHGRGYVVGVDGLAAKAQIAYVPDQPFLYDKLTGTEFLLFVAQMYRVTPADRDRRLSELTDRLDMGDYLDNLTESYSHGMKQRVVLAAALLHDPQVLVVDEPMVGLDPRTVRVVKDLFQERTRRGKTVFMSTHTLGVAEAVADRIGIIDRGRLIAVGKLDELADKVRNTGSLEDIFLQLTHGNGEDRDDVVEQ